MLRPLEVPKSGKTAPHIIGELCNQDGQTFFCSAEKGSLDASIFKEHSSTAITCCGQLYRQKNGLSLSEACDEELSTEISAPIISVSKLDVLKDGNEELVVCTDNGLTYIISTNPNQDIIKYHHRRGIRFLTAGRFGATPCFVYLTCKNHVQVFRNVQLPWLSSKGILEVCVLSFLSAQFLFRDWRIIQRSPNSSVKIAARHLNRKKKWWRSCCTARLKYCLRFL